MRLPTNWYAKKNELAQKSNGSRYYGDGGTIHDSGRLDVEVDETTGEVVAVWFRCQQLPFRTGRVNKARAEDMRQLSLETPALTGVEVRDQT